LKISAAVWSVLWSAQFLLRKKDKMRACFLGQNIFALGFGVATLQSPPLIMDERTGRMLTAAAGEHVSPEDEVHRAPAEPLIGLGPL
jgi:hypothetical protein